MAIAVKGGAGEMFYLGARDSAEGTEGAVTMSEGH